MPRELQSIKGQLNHFMSCSLLTEGSKFSFISDDPSLQLNQALISTRFVLLIYE